MTPQEFAQMVDAECDAAIAAADARQKEFDTFGLTGGKPVYRRLTAIEWPQAGVIVAHEFRRPR